MMQKIHNAFGDIFNGISYFKGIFSLQLKPDSKPYQVPPRHVAYMLQKPFKEELQHLQKMDIIVSPLGVDEIAEWCHSFVLVPKANSKVRLCLDPACLNQALIRPIHRGLTLNDILPRLNNVQYMSIFDASSGYKIVNDMPNVFGITDDILVTGYNKDGADHNEAVYSMLRQCQVVSLKLNKDKCHFRCSSIAFFGEVVSREGVQPYLQNIKALTDMPVPKNKREQQAFIGIINYLGRFSPATVEVSEPL